MDGVRPLVLTLEVQRILRHPGSGQRASIRVESEALDDVEAVTVRKAPVRGKDTRLETHGIDNQHIVLPPADRMAGAAWSDAGGMLCVQVDRALEAHRAVAEDKAIVFVDDPIDI